MTEIQVAGARKVKTTKASIIVDLDDGRTITAPLSWYPRITGQLKNVKNSRLIGRGEGIHWPELDEDVSVETCLSPNIPEKHQNLLRNGWEAVHPNKF
jgi:hypothetical protein